ncbi:M14 family metallopeptidase [Comamonadaceae bacterium M7527]|nr:M14 family metallopeptidase [Comamonadaceae bacterium M7527]
MHIQQHSLVSPATGTQRSVQSLHFGTPGMGQKVYIQASLHADELPGMLVAHHLRALFTALEASDQLNAEVVLVPMANPIGLDQTLMYAQLGRFELASGENFNRHYPDFAAAIGEQVAPLLTQDQAHNRTLIRQLMQRWLAEQPITTELASLRNTLMRLACDADVVLDLHCDFEAAMHLYVETPYLEQAQPLAQALGARALLWAQSDAATLCFDEALSGVWWRLRKQLHQHPIPLACLASTVELRGQADVGHEQALADAQAIIDFLKHRGAVKGTASLPVAQCEATPLAGSQTLCAPHAGVIAYHAAPGQLLKTGDVMADIVCPATGHVSAVCAEVDGVLYARHVLRWATTGMDIGKIAGATAFKTGPLLSA